MHLTRHITGRRAAALGAIAVLAGCAEAPTGPAALDGLSFHFIPATNPELEYVALCKAGPEGTYTFDATANQPVLLNPATGQYNLTAATYSITVGAGSVVDGTTTPGACFRATLPAGAFDPPPHNHIALTGGGTDATVTVVETAIPSGIVFQQAVMYQKTKVGSAAATTAMNSTTTNSASVRLGGDGATPRTLWGGSIVFYNIVEEVPDIWNGETATGAGFPWMATQRAPNNWFMYTPWVTTGSHAGISTGADLIAGQHYVAGQITGTRGVTTSITITLNSGFRFSAANGNVKIYPMSCTPNQDYVSPGKFSVKATAAQGDGFVTVSGLANTACYGIHVDVERLVP